VAAKPTKPLVLAAVKPAATKPVVAAKPTKPLVLAAVKPVDSRKFAKSTGMAPGKPTVQPVRPATAVIAKPEKREIAKVAAIRAEPPAKLQKVAMTKR